jgi:serine/threonine protein kinase
VQAEAAPAVEPRTPAQALPGTVLAGRYRLDALIGGGSFGTVFRALHLELEREVAVKVLATSAGTDPEALARFRREGASACRVQHPNAVAVLDFGVNPGGVAYLVMELLRGRSLEKELEEKAMLPPRRCAEIVVPVCSALAAAHAAGIVHRDIKPSNIMLDEDGRASLTDFGLSKGREDTTLTRAGQVMGTIDYLAPEVLRGSEPAPPSDVYALGCVVFECLAGLPPFGDQSLAEVGIGHLEQTPPDPCARRADAPPGLSEIVLQALAKRPEDRPPTATAYARMLIVAERGSA